MFIDVALSWLVPIGVQKFKKQRWGKARGQTQQSGGLFSKHSDIAGEESCRDMPGVQDWVRARFFFFLNF